jgi:signal transduction histidine kinase
MGAQSDRFAERYRASLREYLEAPGEAQRSRAYELGRRSLAEGLGVLDLAAAHCEALRRLGRGGATSAVSGSVVERAGDFFAECLSPFEMSHRGAREGARAWQRLNEALENEAKRIAHALHDEAGQLLASVHLAIAEIAGELPPRSRARLEEVRRLLDRIETELRNLSHELRPTLLDRLGLLPALQFLAESVGRRAGIPIAVKGEDPGRLPPTVEITLYRVVQEALNNVAKHARAGRAGVDLDIGPERVSCTVRDDGVGFDPARLRRAQGIGLVGIRERLHALGGSLRVTSRPSRGTTLRAEIPRGH